MATKKAKAKGTTKKSSKTKTPKAKATKRKPAAEDELSDDNLEGVSGGATVTKPVTRPVQVKRPPFVSPGEWHK